MYIAMVQLKPVNLFFEMQVEKQVMLPATLPDLKVRFCCKNIILCQNNLLAIAIVQGTYLAINMN